MPIYNIKPLLEIPAPQGSYYADLTAFSPGSAPPRPTPGPTPPGWKPGDPYPSHPIEYPPGTSPGYPGWGGSGPHPEFPIVLPPTTPGQPPVEVEGHLAVVAPWPTTEGAPPVPPLPADAPPGSTWNVAVMEKGAKPAQILVYPYAAPHA